MNCNVYEEKNKIIIGYFYEFIVYLYAFIKIISSSFIEKFLIFNISNISYYFNFFCIFALITVFFLQNKISVKKFIISGVYALIVGLISAKYIDMNLIITFLLIVTFPKDIKLNLLIKRLFFVSVIAIVIVLTESKFGLIMDRTFIQHNALRHSCGFVSANTFANNVALCMLMYIYCKFERWNIKKTIFWIVIISCVYYYSRSRLALLISIFAIILALLLKTTNKHNKIKKIIYNLAICIIPFLSIFCIFISIYFTYNPQKTELYSVVDNIFTGRLSWIIKYNNEYGIHFLGNKIETVSIKESMKTGEGWKNIDNAYINFSIKYGILFLFLFNYLYITLGRYVKKKQELKDAIMIISIGIIGITENFLIIVPYNFTAFFIAKMLSESKIGENKNE